MVILYTMIKQPMHAFWLSLAVYLGLPQIRTRSNFHGRTKNIENTRKRTEIEKKHENIIIISKAIDQKNIVDIGPIHLGRQISTSV